MDSLDLENHQMASSADLFFPTEHHHDMESTSDQTQQQETADTSSTFLNGTGGSNMGMAGVMAALQSLGGSSRNPSLSDNNQPPAAPTEDPGAGQGQGQLREQIILEQFKLAQLKQLQELQQQIFQQQMALLNGGNPSLENQPRDQRGGYGLPTPGSSTELRPTQPIPLEFVSPMLLNYGDLDPTTMSLDIPNQTQYSRDNTASHTPGFPPHDTAGLDMDIGSFAALTPLSATSTTNPHHFGGSSANSANQFPPSSQFDGQTTNPNGTASARAHEHYFTNRGTASAPAHIAFGNPFHSSNHSHSSHHHGMNMGMDGLNPMSMSSEPSSPMHSELDFDVSPLTSPWLGAKITGSNNSGSNGRIQAYGHHHNNNNQSLQNRNPHSTTTQAGVKRAASPNADIDVDVVFGAGAGRSRKRQASISQSPNTMRPSVSPVIRPTHNSSSNSSSRSRSSGSRSMNSTPLMRGTNPNSRTRRGSVVNNNANSPLAMAIGMNGGSTNFTGIPSPSIGSGSGSTIRGMGRNGENGSNNNDVNNSSNIGFGVVGDSPSPVDLSLSMPPPAAPASAFEQTTGATPTASSESLVPVTPASIMNLGGSFSGLGGGLGSTSQSQSTPIPADTGNTSSANGNGAISASNSSSSTSSSGNATPRATAKGSGRVANAKNDKEAGAVSGPAGGTRKSGRRAGGAAASENSTLKHILPAGGKPSTTFNSIPRTSTSAAASSTSTIVPVKERKTSHKAAEQKRRDSLKTTFDDLRTLLPPIPLPTDDKGGAAAMDDGTGIGFIALAKASLLPGALPPRGPPKAGGEGPNKGVSKLQLLICGNEYIRVLKGRVDRRDEELDRLRKEVRRLRVKLGDAGVMEDDEEFGGGLGGEGGEYGSGSGETLDLDRDLDAVEVLESMKAQASVGQLNGGGSTLAGVDEDVDEE